MATAMELEVFTKSLSMRGGLKTPSFGVRDEVESA